MKQANKINFDTETKEVNVYFRDRCIKSEVIDRIDFLEPANMLFRANRNTILVKAPHFFNFEIIEDSGVRMLVMTNARM